MTDFAALDALYPVPPGLLSRQWLLTENAELAPADWTRHQLGSWILAAHPDAHVCPLFDQENQPIGWILEPLVHLSVTGSQALPERLDLPIEEDDLPGSVEAALYGRDDRGRSTDNGVEGAWTAILLGPRGRGSMQRIYLGSLSSAVYAADKRVVAATANLIPHLERDLEISRAFDTLATRIPVTLGLTPFRGVRRLIQNHCLDLQRFEVLRHWPADDLGSEQDHEAEVGRFIAGSSRLASALSPAFRRFDMLLSAGRDSRAVLSLLREVIASGEVETRTTTSRGADIVSRTDAKIAAQLSEIAGLPHEITSRAVERPSTHEGLINFIRIGEAVASRGVAGASRLPPPTAGTLTLPGMGGEIARTYFWPSGPPSSITPGMLVRRLQAPPIPATLDAATLWLDGLPAGLRDRPGTVLDLAYVEQRLGAAETPLRYLRPGAHRNTLNLLGTTLAVDIMLRLPEHYRRSGRFQEDVVRQAWPELMALPFNKMTGWGRVEAVQDALRFHARRVFLRARGELSILTRRRR